MANVKKISRLNNSYMYALNDVFILLRDESYRLVVIKKKRVLYDKEYETIRGARIAFKRLFTENALNPGPGKKIKPIWSHAYIAESDWIEPRLKITPNMS